MIKVTLTNDMLKKISAIDENRFSLNTMELPTITKNRLRKNSKKKSSYASNKIEGNPLSEKQADEVIERDGHKHFLKPEQEIRNYFLALNLLEEKLKKYVSDQKRKAIEELAEDEELSVEALADFFREYDYLQREKTEIIQDAIKNRKTKVGLVERRNILKRVMGRIRTIIDTFNWD